MTEDSVRPSRTIEIERKYDVDADTPLPAWIGIDAVDAVTSGELRELDARYFDTEDAELARAGVAVRRRTGGPDAGWHIKGPREGDGRLEIAWPLNEGPLDIGVGDMIPEAVVGALARWTTAPLRPLARIENSRTAYLLTGPDGVVAEFVDDRVRATDLRQPDHLNTPVRREWREWEVELGPSAPDDGNGRATLFAEIETAVFAAGARSAASDSKLARALGH